MGIFIIIGTFIIFVATIVGSIVQNVNVYLSLTFVVWILSMGYYLYNYKTNIANICFMVAFFVFLMGREMCFYYFGMPKYYIYSDEINELTFCFLLISLFAVNMGSLIETILSEKFIFFNKRISYFNEIRYVSGIAYYFCYIFLIISVFSQIRYVQEVGYLGSYLGKGATIPGYIAYIALFTPTALCLYLVSLPSKIQSILAMLFYEFYAILTLFTGQRFPFIGISMLLMSYCVLRERYEGEWIRKKFIYGAVLSIPFLLLFLNAFDSIRVGKGFELGNLYEIFLRFCDLQGGSVNVIKRTLYWHEELRDVNFWSLSTIKGLWFENFISRNLFDVTVYYGNSVENALFGNSLAHRLSWYSYGDMYLMGRGVGTSYIAELYADIGVLGVIVGSIFYGIVLKKISKLDFKNPIYDGILFSMLYHLLFAPRGEFDGFTRWFCNIISMPGIIFILFLAQQLYKSKMNGVVGLMDKESIQFNVYDCVCYVLSKKMLIIFCTVLSTCLAGVYSYFTTNTVYLVETRILLPVDVKDKYVMNSVELLNQRNGELGFKKVALIKGTSILKLSFEDRDNKLIVENSKKFTEKALINLNSYLKEQYSFENSIKLKKELLNDYRKLQITENLLDDRLNIISSGLDIIQNYQFAKILYNEKYQINTIVDNKKRKILIGLVLGLFGSLFYVICGYFAKLGKR